MIVQLFIAALANVLSFVLGTVISALIPSSWASGIAGAAANASSFMASVWAEAASLGVWFPWGILGPALTIAAGVFAVAIAVKFVRIVLSLFTGGGGSAA